MSRTAGEVRFIKDRGNDQSGWAWNDAPPAERKIAPDFPFDPKKTKILARVLRSTMMALGHTMSGYTLFAKLKSADISPDGSLGGKGYIQNIKDLRRSYMNIVEALSANADTFYDELHAPHWAAVSRQEDPEDRKEVEQVLQEVDDIKDDPEAWAEDEEDEFDQEHSEDEYDLDEEDKPARGKKAGSDFFAKILKESLDSAHEQIAIDRKQGHEVFTQNGVIKYITLALGLLRKPEPTPRDKKEALQRLALGATMILTYLEHDDKDTDNSEGWGVIRSNLTMAMSYLSKDVNRQSR